MKIGFVGAGGMAQALAGKWAGKHDVMISGRNAAKTKEASEALGVDAGAVRETHGNVA